MQEGKTKQFHDNVRQLNQIGKFYTTIDINKFKANKILLF